MFLLARKGFADRIKLRSVFGGDSVLLKHGLLRWSQAPPLSPNLLGEEFEISPCALDQVILAQE